MTGWRPGLLARVLLVQAAVLGLAALLVPLAVDALLEARVEFYERKVLSGRARQIAEAIHATQDDQLRLAPGRYDREGERGEFGFAVLDGAGTPLFSSTPFAARLLAPAPRRATQDFSEIASDGRHYAVTSLPLSVEGRSLWVILGWDLDADQVIADDVARGFLSAAVVIVVPLLLLLLGLNVLVIRRFFRPVLRVADQVRELDPARVDARLPARDLPPEILPLATAFNAALDRVERGALLQKEFTADAAHELRTPLAVLDARLQTLSASTPRDELLADARRMGRVVSQLLDLARLERLENAAEDVDLLAVCRSVVGDLAPEAIAKGQELWLDAPDGLEDMHVAIPEQDAWHMLRNLVENAIRHTPSGTTITVRLAPPGTLEVRDDGPGIPAELHAQVFRRFWRARRNEGAGSGLGLAIVQRVAEAGGGSVSLRSEAGQGTSFVVTLPPRRLA